MQQNIPQVFDREMHRLCYLQNAFDVGYTLPLNELWTATFSLPADDPKNGFCAGRNYVEIYDGERRIGLFRIIGADLSRSDTAAIVYNCEHVLATLLDDVLFQYHQTTLVDARTTIQVLQYILAQQTSERWVLGGCDFTRRFEYNFENENLLSSLFSVPRCFDEEYRWEWNTESAPWRLYLRAANTELKSEIRYQKNMTEITRAIDYSPQANRIYALGYGEGDNQLTIRDVNQNTPYVEDAASQQEYGLVASILADTRFEHPDTLKAYAQALLRQYKDPYITYTASALDLFRLNGDDFCKFAPGDVIRVIDTVDNIVVNTRIVQVEKTDVRGDPGAVNITLANKNQNIASSISDLQNRAIINETYSQGATNLLQQTFSDNADPEHPAKFRLYFPAEMVRVNKVKLQVEFEPFRGFSKGVASTEQQSATSSSGGGSTTSSGGGGNQTSSAGGGSTETSSAKSLTSSNTVNDPYDLGGPGGANHNHGLDPGMKIAYVDDSLNVVGYRVFVPSGKHTHPSHSHTINIPRHSHSVSIPAHTHSVGAHTHRFTIPSHTHGMQYGIYEGSTADSAALIVDGQSVPVEDWDEVDIVSKFETDDSGKITRDRWHVIEIAPNVMSRVVASVFVQIFCNSRGSGDY